MGAGILDLIGNSLAMRNQRHAEKDRENLEGLIQALYGVANPSIQSDLENSKQDVDYYVGQMVGPGYKEHQPFVQQALHGVGNAVLGAFGLQLPQKHVPQIPVAQPAPAAQPPAPTEGPGINYTPRTGPGVNYSPATLTAAPAPPEPPQSLPGGSVPPSVLAPGGPTGIGPSALTGGVPVGKQPGAPMLMPLSREVIRGGKLDVLAGRGTFGKTAEQTQEFFTDLHKAVAQGHLTPDEAKDQARHWLLTEGDPTKAVATGTNREVFYEKPAGVDPKTGQPTPSETKILLENSRNPDELIDPDTGDKLTLKQAGLQFGHRTLRPPADIPKPGSVRADDPTFVAYMRDNFPNINLDQFAPDQRFNIARTNRGAGPFTGFPTLDASPSSSNRNIEAQMAEAARKSLEERNPQTGEWQKIKPARAEQIAGKMFLNYRGLINARLRNNLDISAYTWGIPITSQDLPSDVRIAGGGQVVQPQPPGSQDTGVSGGARDDAAARMQGLPGGQPGATRQTPNLVPGNLPAGAQPAAAGTPSAAPSASGPPQVPATHPPTVPQPQVQRPVQPQPQAAVPAAAQQQPGGVAPDSVYLGAYMSSLDPSQTGPKPLQREVSRGRVIFTQRIADMIQREEGRQVTPEEVAARVSNAETEWGAQMGLQRENAQRAVATEGVVNTLDQFARQFVYQSRQIPDHGSLLANSFARDIVAKFQTNPKLASYKALGLGLAETWGTMINSATLSKGQLQEGALSKTLDKINTNAPQQEVAETMSRILLEGQTEKWRYKDIAWKIEQAKANTLLGKISNYGATIGPQPPEPHYVPPPADGTIKKIRGTNQFVHYDAILGRYVAGAQ